MARDSNLIVPICNWGFPGGSGVKNSPARTEDTGSIPGSGRSPRKGKGNQLQYACLGNTMEEDPVGL